MTIDNSYKNPLENSKKYNRDIEYIKIKQIGNKGKDGVTYLVKTKNNRKYAMKTFKNSKSSNRIKREADIQRLCSEYNIAPAVYNVNLNKKYIVMEQMDKHLLDIIDHQKGNLNKVQQNNIISIYKKLDKIGVFHGDSNMMNYMLKDKKIYMIDYGMSKIITPNLCKELGTDKPNMKLMLLGFILKLKELNCLPTSYKYLIEYIDVETRNKFNL
jgi:tRNA A-37 threonylcarbamoyl transferase component Bud32